MEGGAGGDGEGVEDVGDHFCGELADLFAFEAELGDAVGARADVNDGAGEGLLGWGGESGADSSEYGISREGDTAATGKRN